MRSKFDAQLKELGEKLTLMGAMCEEAIANSAKALLTGDSELAKKLAPLDLEIDRYERDIEALCLRLLLQQQQRKISRFFTFPQAQKAPSFIAMTLTGQIISALNFSR